jgi:hypothetical protein
MEEVGRFIRSPSLLVSALGAGGIATLVLSLVKKEREQAGKSTFLLDRLQRGSQGKEDRPGVDAKVKKKNYLLFNSHFSLFSRSLPPLIISHIPENQKH